MAAEEFEFCPVDPLEPEADAEVQATLDALKLVRKRYPGEHSRIRAGGVEIGGDEFILMAGPCAVESERQVMEVAEAVARAGARVLRGGGFKPRTSPYTFQGLGREGLKLLRKAADAFSLAAVSDAMTGAQAAIAAEYADIIQVGTRSMENVALLAALSRSGRAVLLKRGMVATLEELLTAAEYLLANGNPNVILCERGIRTFGRLTRNTCDLVAVPLLNQLTHLPVIIDPSHATGRQSLVPAVCRAAVAIGADGLLVEAHTCPQEALSDGLQSLSIPQFEAMVRSLRPYLELWREARAADLAAVSESGRE